MSPLPPSAHRRLLSGVMLVLVLGCGRTDPGVGGLLVATGGPLRVTDASGNLSPVEGPQGPVVSVAAGGGRLVAATEDGRLFRSDGPGRPWDPLAAPANPAIAVALIALSPAGELAIVAGDPQGDTFELVLVDTATNATRSITVDRGLNGPPAWVGPSTVVLDVVAPDGASDLAAIDVATGAVTDLPGASRIVSATADGRRVAVDDPSGGVLLGETATWRAGRPTELTPLAPAADPADGLAISPDGSRLAVIRRGPTGAATIDLNRSQNGGWTLVRTIPVAGDGPISIAWIG